MAGATIGTAYIQVLPSAQGIKGNLQTLFGGDAESAGKGIGSKLGGGIMSGLKGIGVAAAAAITAAAGTAVAIGKQAISSFAEYEQLAGGAKLIWGDAYDTIAEHAANAYKEVQMSQNDYLNAVNGYAVGLKTAMGGDEQAAADLANSVIRAQADVVAALGKDPEAVSNAFSGVMRGNFTMLDNLGLGIAGSQKGMKQVIKEVNAWNKANGNATKYQMGNLADMEAALVDYIEMQGLAGYAQNEASETIQGSLASTKAAWSDLLTGFASDDADLDNLINNFVESALNLGNLIMPRIGNVMSGLSKLLGEALPEIVPVIMQFITDNAGTLADAGIQIFIAILTGFVTAIPELLNALPQIWESIKTAFAENGPAIGEAAWQAFLWIGHGVNNALSSAGEYISTHFSEWISYAGYLAQDFGQTISDGFSALAHEVGMWITENIITPASDAVKGIIAVGQQVVDNIKEGISNAWGGLVQWFKGLWDGVFGHLKANITVNTKSGESPSGFATGLDYVPYDEFPAILHKGEAVLTAEEAGVWRNGGSKGSGTIINQYIQTVPQSPVQLAAATAAQFELARWAI